MGKLLLKTILFDLIEEETEKRKFLNANMISVFADDHLENEITKTDKKLFSPCSHPPPIEAVGQWTKSIIQKWKWQLLHN